MEIIKTASFGGAGAEAAHVISAFLEENSAAVLGFATGSSPVPLYAALEQIGINSKMTKVQGFALDEYIGLRHDHPNSYAQIIHREVIERLGMNASLVRFPDGLAADVGKEAASYEQCIRDAGGINIQILGIGSNGHLAFNEPGSSFASRTRVVKLTKRTRKDNARFFRSIEDVPTHAITQGLGTILEAEHLLLISHGRGKASAIAQAIEGPVSERFPASIIQRHPNVTVVLDEASASKLA